MQHSHQNDISSGTDPNGSAFSGQNQMREDSGNFVGHEMFQPLLRGKDGRDLQTILEAATDVIPKESQSNPLAYFAALLSTLDREKNPKIIQNILLIICFLNSKVQDSVFRSRYDFILTLYSGLLQGCSQNEDIIKPLLSCCTYFLCRLENAWSQKKTIQFLHQLFQYINDQRQDVKKQASRSVSQLLDTKKDTIVKQVTNYFAKMSTTLFGQCTSNDFQTVLHILQFYQYNLFKFSIQGVLPIVKSMMRLLTLGNSSVSVSTYKVLDNLFKQKTLSLPLEFLSMILKSLASNIPSQEKYDSALHCSYMNALTHGTIKLIYEFNNSNKDEEGYSYILSLFDILSSYFQMQAEDVVSVAGRLTCKTIQCCISEKLIEEAYRTMNVDEQGEKTKSVVLKIISSLESSLNVKNQANLDVVFNAFSELFKKLGKRSLPLLQQILVTVTNLRDQKVAKVQSSLEQVIAGAIQGVGPERILEVVPLNLTGQNVPPRPWLLPLFKNNIRNTELRYFITYFYPLALKFKKRSAEAEEEGLKVEAKNMMTYFIQVISLLPGFCSQYPTDFKDSFKLIVKEIASLMEKDDVEGTGVGNIACNTLIQIVRVNQRVIDEGKAEVSTYTVEDAKSNIKELSKYCKNFLPILFNLFSSTSKQSKNGQKLDREELEKCITAVASISESGLVNQYFKEIVKNLLQASTANVSTSLDVQANIQRKQDLTELSIPLVQYLSEESIALLYRVIKPQLQAVNDFKLQKKSYKVLFSMLKYHPKYLQENFLEICETLCSAISTLHSPSKLFRSRCLLFLVKYMPNAMVEQLLPQFLGETLMGTKEANSETRECYFKILKALAEKIAFGTVTTLIGNDDPKVQHEKQPNAPQPEVSEEGKKRMALYVRGLIGGLGGKTNLMVSATIDALAELLQTYTDAMESTIAEVLDSVFILVKTTSREVLSSVLDFIIIANRIVDQSLMMKHIPSLCQEMLNHLRDGVAPVPGAKALIQHVFRKLIKKYGQDVEKYVPEQHMKYVKNIEKMVRTSQNKKKRRNEETKRGSENRKMFLTDSDDIPLDLSDPSSLSTSRSALVVENGGDSVGQAKKNDSENFSIRNGKMVIEDEEQVKKQKKTSKKESFDDDIDDDDDDENPAAKFYKDEEGEDDEEEEDEEQRRGKRQRTERGQFAQQKNKSKKQNPLANAFTGSEYKARKKGTGGDMKRRNKPDPYAYLPLDPTRLNKRNKTKDGAFHKFDSMTKAARSGSSGKKRKR